MTSADTVLIVDDDLQLGKFTAEVLELAGFNVEHTPSGREGLERVGQSPSRYQAVVLDRRMPDIDGLTVLRRLKASSTTREIPVVLLTGLSSAQDIIAGIAAGAYYYVTKPFRGSMLQTVVRAAIGDFQARVALRLELASSINAIGLLHSGEFRFQAPHAARAVAGLLAHCTRNPDVVVTGLWELLINAIEHGNLGISYAEKSELVASGQWHNEITKRLSDGSKRDKYATVTVAMEPQQVVFTVADQGPGFDPQPYFEFEPARATHLHGRGIAMARRLSFTSVEFLGNGNLVRATSARAERVDPTLTEAA